MRAGKLVQTIDLSGYVTSVSASSPISSSGGATPNITIADAGADGATKGAAGFAAADFTASSGIISLAVTHNPLALQVFS